MNLELSNELALQDGLHLPGLLPDADRQAKMRGGVAGGVISVLLTCCLGMSGSLDLDWASGCRDTNGCECKWVHGKRTATCSPQLNLDKLPEFPAPDRIQVRAILIPQNREL